jgi:hypothetical protein
MPSSILSMARKFKTKDSGSFLSIQPMIYENKVTDGKGW